MEVSVLEAQAREVETGMGNWKSTIGKVVLILPEVWEDDENVRHSIAGRSLVFGGTGNRGGR